MAQVPLPDVLPGRFFVLEWNRDIEQYILYLDTIDRPSYKLGGDVAKLMVRFRVWGQYDLGCRALDIAREFGRVQAIMKSGRTIPLYERPSQVRRTVQFAEEQAYAGYLPDP